MGHFLTARNLLVNNYFSYYFPMDFSDELGYQGRLVKMTEKNDQIGPCKVTK